MLRLKVLNETGDEGLGSAVAARIAEVYGFDVVVENGLVSSAEKAWNSQRRQYDAEKLVKHIHPGEPFVLILTGRDLYVEGLNFVFGYAPPPVGVLSIHRLKPSVEVGGFGRSLLLDRVLKEAVHEVGHLIGLRHCSAGSCVMSFSNSVDEVDLKSGELCERCRGRATFLLRQLHSR
ncbi:MAG: archaemetzincin family Zn-dependent metalloprotease [Candidatus Caldarchaeum sp.]